MTTITFDTHEFIKKLQDAGFSEQQAEAISAAQKESLSQALSSEVATKGDIAKLENRLDRIENRLEALELRLTIKLGSFIMLATGILIAVFKL